MDNIKFTKKQQQRIDSCTGRIRQTWIEHFTQMQKMKQMPAVKAFNKQIRAEYKALG